MSDVEARLASAAGQALPVRRASAATGRPIKAAGNGWRLTGALVVSDAACGAVGILMASGVAELIGIARFPPLPDFVAQEIAAILPLLVGLSILLGVYGGTTMSQLERFRRRATANATFIFSGTLLWAQKDIAIALGVVPLAGLVSLVLGTWMDLLLRSAFWRSHSGAPTAILGTGSKSQFLAGLLSADPTLGLRPIGFVADGQQQSIAPAGAGKSTQFPILDIETSLGSGARETPEVLVVPNCRALFRNELALSRWRFRTILLVDRFDVLPSFGLQMGHFTTLQLAGPSSPLSSLAKRALDLAFATPLLLLTAPVLALLALAIKISDPGPSFYRQWRVGRDGKPIQVLKLRTMYQNAEQRLQQVLASDSQMREQWHRFYKLTRDPRILPGIGGFLRRTSLDEVPQLWNVMRGDMSLVGPRPFPKYHLDAFDPAFRDIRASVPPGLTGLWQISSRSDGDLETQRAQDGFYIRNRSLWLDLYILIATIPAVIAGQGAK
jgi:lipopolysaccharide/colanic/teichoic acid biosynthesis glycosyltransferase